MLDPLATYSKSQALFTPSADAGGALNQAHATDELFSQAYFGNSEAIGILISVAAGADDPSGLRAKVEQGLLDLYSSPNTSAHVRQGIATQAHAFHELAERNAHKAGSTLHLKLPFKLLYLAGVHESSRYGLSMVLNKIARTFLSAITALGEDIEKNILSGTRYLTAVEMSKSHTPLLAFGGQPEILNLSWPDQVIKSVREISAELISPAPDAPKAKAVFLLVGDGHWIPLVLRREGDRVGAYVIDSSWWSGFTRHTSVTRMMEAALGERLSSFHYKYTDLQAKTANACGILSTRFISWIDNQLAEDPAIDIPAAIDDYVTQWKELTTDQKMAYVVGMRAEKLALVAQAANQGSRFAQEA